MTSFGLAFLQAYGMTETSPIATVCRLQSHMEDWEPAAQQIAMRAKQGLPVPGMELKLVDDAGAAVSRATVRATARY